jgi:hypothetical protein
MIGAESESDDLSLVKNMLKVTSLRLAKPQAVGVALSNIEGVPLKLNGLKLNVCPSSFFLFLFEHFSC